MYVHSLTQVTDTEAERLSVFFSRNTYFSGKYGDEGSFSKLNTHILSLPGGAEGNRLFYLALPPTVYHDVTKNIKHHCMTKKSVNTFMLITIVLSSCLLAFQKCVLPALAINTELLDTRPSAVSIASLILLKSSQSQGIKKDLYPQYNWKPNLHPVVSLNASSEEGQSEHRGQELTCLFYSVYIM